MYKQIQFDDINGHVHELYVLAILIRAYVHYIVCI